MRRLADTVLRNSKYAAEIGCGHGLLQKTIEDYYGIPVTGFDLNEVAFQKNVSRLSPGYCYDVHQRKPEFSAHFDLLLLFDVLEHIENENDFLQSAKFYLKDSGTLLVNVPAHPFFHTDLRPNCGAHSAVFGESLGECCAKEWFQDTRDNLLGTASGSPSPGAERDLHAAHRWQGWIRYQGKHHQQPSLIPGAM